MRERTPFGERLYTARTHAKLTQKQLAKAADISQSNLGELEYDGDGSSATVRLAVACGVRPEWLSEGQGEMLDTFTWPFQRIDKERVLALEVDDLAYVEGKLSAALEEVEQPSPEDLAAFVASHERKAKPTQRRRRA